MKVWIQKSKGADKHMGWRGQSAVGRQDLVDQDGGIMIS